MPNTSSSTTPSHRVAVGDQIMTVQMVYADGSAIELRMPLPENAEHNTHEHLQQFARRMAARLMSVAIEDLERAIAK
jgi:hypothetical protein